MGTRNALGSTFAKRRMGFSCIGWMCVAISWNCQSLTVVGHQQAAMGPIPAQVVTSTEIISVDEKVAGRTLQQWAKDLGSDNEIVRLRATKTLGAFGEDAIPHLADALNDRSEAVQYWAADALGRISDRVKADKRHAAIVKRLVQIKDESDRAVAMAAAYALCQLDSIDLHLTLLIDRLDHPERGMACSAAEFLGKIGPPAKLALPQLDKQFRQHEDYHVRGACQNAIRKIKRSDDP